ncbi:MAG: hypothetical protein LBN43_08960 [Oscillospiraceae bacterium]|jgi:hypothetical protein|nr:hypothetical protein [Oscillospiraceae bacterium]
MLPSGFGQSTKHNKSCPFNASQKCLGNTCAIFDNAHNKCSVYAISVSLDRLAQGNKEAPHRPVPATDDED